ncbi:oxygen-dependent coproporphyrinogen oxidase [Siphonobacter sp.]|uniref:oxygen-dependent coproporphyrinogen oxidase n=1 Tax=Siphonobacter sp. TaxID=1869184 RepID=UPI003B3B164D
MIDKHQISEYFKGLQDHICQELEKADGKAQFREDHWERPGGGGGRSRVIADGAVLEKGGVGFSAVSGEIHPKMRASLGVEEGTEFFATGVSIVQHPVNPNVPIIHMNVRYFELSTGSCWFGGGIDLTPHYVNEADARWFHQQLKAACDRFSLEYYPKFKNWADDYFFSPHRDETRGIGGIFYDYLKPSDTQSKEHLFAFTKAIGESFAPIYTSLMLKHRDEPYTEAQRDWQLLRRGRYVEFNLVHDRGTKFGLETNGRTESILMSLPPLARWEYDHHPEPGSAEAQTLAWLRKGVDWV